VIIITGSAVNDIIYSNSICFSESGCTILTLPSQIGNLHCLSCHFFIEHYSVFPLDIEPICPCLCFPVKCSNVEPFTESSTYPPLSPRGSRSVTATPHPNIIGTFVDNTLQFNWIFCKWKWCIAVSILRKTARWKLEPNVIVGSLNILQVFSSYYMLIQTQKRFILINSAWIRPTVDCFISAE